MLRVRCPHCLEMVQVEEATDGSLVRCPVCAEDLAAAYQEGAHKAGYEVDAHNENAPQSTGLRDYVDALEKTARKERKRQPYHRGGFPVNLVAGLILIAAGLAFLVYAFMVREGFMSSLVNGIFPAAILFLIGTLCLVFWRK